MRLATPMDEFWAYDYLINPINPGCLVVIKNPKKSAEDILNNIKKVFLRQSPESRVQTKLVTMFGYLFHKPMGKDEHK
jgi:hypothetical protein